MESERILARRGPAAASAISPCHVLLVEDEADLAEAMQAALEDAGLRVTVMASGEQAHAAYVEQRPDCVILDLILPGRSGFDICQTIKRTDPAATVIVLTGIDAGDSRELARLVGADGYLVKPLDPPRLIAEIRAAVHRTNSKPSEKPKSKSSSSPGDPASPNGERIQAPIERVVLRCRCGRRFQVSAAHRGKNLPCPTCGDSLAVPRA
jgi:DNA-binding response OmpR family regulator